MALKQCKIRAYQSCTSWFAHNVDFITCQPRWLHCVILTRCHPTWLADLAQLHRRGHEHEQVGRGTQLAAGRGGAGRGGSVRMGSTAYLSSLYNSSYKILPLSHFIFSTLFSLTLPFLHFNYLLSFL